MIPVLLNAVLTASTFGVPANQKDDPQETLRKERDEKNRLLVQVDVLRAEKAWESDNINQVRELMQKHIPAKGATDYRGPEWHKLYALYRHQLREIPGDVSSPWHWSPDSRFVATIGILQSRQITITNVGTGERHTLACEGRNEEMDWSPEGRWFAVTNRTSTVAWDATTKTERKLLNRPTPEGFTIYHHAWSKDGKRMACPAGDGTVRVLEVATGKEVLKLSASVGAHTARWSADGTKIAVAGSKGISAYAADSGKELFAHEYKVALPIEKVVEWSPKATWLAVSTSEGLQILDGKSGKKVWTFKGADSSGAIQPNDCPLVWMAQDENLLAWIKGPEGRPPMTPHGRFFALWDLKTGKSIHHWNKPDESPFRLKDGVALDAFLYGGTKDRLLEWSLSILQKPAFAVWSISPEVKRISTGAAPLKENDQRQVNIFAMSPDGKRVAAVLPASYDDAQAGRGSDELIVWDANSGKIAFRTRGFRVTTSGSEGTRSMTWSPDGSRIILVGGRIPGSRLKVFDAATATDGK